MQPVRRLCEPITGGHPNLKRTMSLFVIVTALLLGAVSMQACEVSTASIGDVRICDNLQGDECPEDKQVISTDASYIYLSAQLKDAPEGTQVTYTLRDLDTGDEVSNTWTADEGGSGPFNLTWSRPEDGWVAGEYELVLDLGTDNSEPVSKRFEIRQAG